jgi:hypothetical protein
MKKSLLYLPVIILLLIAGCATDDDTTSGNNDNSNYTRLSGDLTSDLALDDAPFLVTGDVTIPAGASVTIDPGVEIRFDGPYCILVYG